MLRVPTYSPTSVAEHSVALALSLCRKIPQAFDRARFQNYELSGLVGFQMKGKTVGIWGTGAIGTAAVAIYKVNFSFDFSFFSRFRVRGRKQRRKEKKNSKFQKKQKQKKRAWAAAFSPTTECRTLAPERRGPSTSIRKRLC